MSVCPITGTIYLHDVYAQQSGYDFPALQQELPYDWNGLKCSIVYSEGVTPQIIIGSPLLETAEPEIFLTDDAPVPLSPPQEVMWGSDVYSMPETFYSYQSCDAVEQWNGCISTNIPHAGLETACENNSYGLAPVPSMEPELYPAQFHGIENHFGTETYGNADNVREFQAIEPPFDVENTVAGSQYLPPPPTTIPQEKVQSCERHGECRLAECSRTIKVDQSDTSKHLKGSHHPDLRKLGPDSRAKCLLNCCKRKRDLHMNMARRCVSAGNHLIDQHLCDFCHNATYSNLEGFYEHLSICPFSPLYRCKVPSRRSYKNPELAQRSPTFVMVQQNRAMNTIDQSL